MKLTNTNGKLEHLTPLYNGKKSLTGAQWVLENPPLRDVMTLCQKQGLPDFIARILVNRGVIGEAALYFMTPKLKDLLPDPFHFKDMDKAVHRTIQAINAGHKITIFGDYDVDGATSSALLKRFFKSMGIDANIYIPDRLEEGYGPSVQAMEFLKDQGTNVVIIVDSGTTAFDPLARAQELGMDVIVLDHHISEPKLPQACAIVNPNRIDEASPHTYLAAVGMTFMFVYALVKTLKKQGFSRPLPDVRQYLDLVALGTVCDIVPLKPLNRAFIQQGLKVLKLRDNRGLTALMDVVDIDSLPTAYHLGFLLGPRINAGSRIDQSDLGATLLSSECPTTTQKIAQKLDKLNLERQEIESYMIDSAIALIESQGLHHNPVICVAKEDWHVGVIGIVAGRLKEKYKRPTLVIALDKDGIGKGSGRSMEGFDLGSAMHAARQKDLLVSGGGHAMAAGLTIHKDKLDDFNKFLQTRLPNGPLEVHLKIDAPLSVRGITPDLCDTIDNLAPFGPANPTPKVLIENVTAIMPKVVGKDHISCILKSEDGASIPAIAFRAAHTPLGDFLLNSKGHRCHVVGTLKHETWQGRSKAKVIISDIMVPNDD